MSSAPGSPNNDHLTDLLFDELKDVGIFRMDLERQIISWSPGIERILGFSEGEFIGRNGSTLFTPEDRERKVDDREFDKARTTGRAPDASWLMNKDGSRTFVDGVLLGIFNNEGSCVGYGKIIRDVSAHRIRNRLLEAILDRTPDVIYAKDRDGRYAFANSQFARLIGRRINEVIGRMPEDLFPPRIGAALRQTHNKVIRENKPAVVEECLLSNHHGERTFLIGKAPWHDADGAVVGVVSIAQDISAIKSAEKERQRLIDELRRSNEDLSQFSYVVSHDLQTPLRMVMTYAELLARRCQDKLDDTENEFLSVILNGARGMEQLIRALLRYAQVSDQSLIKATVNLDAVLECAQSNLRTLLNESSTELTIDPLPTVMGDHTQLLQLFQNLIENAIKYAKVGATPQIHVFVNKSDSSEHQISVSDNGVGIDGRNFERIFAPLKRLHGQEVPGTGIGLAVCKKVIERHDGRIWVTSELGKGSTFHFTLPAN